jgi:hypothetical protein
MGAEQGYVPSEEDVNFKADKPYRLEEIIETSGPNLGNIKDIELAQIGAEAENKARDEEKTLKGKLKKALWEKTPVFRPTEIDYMKLPDIEGSSAMIKEVETRAASSAEGKEMADTGAFSKKMGQKFDYEQQRATWARKREQGDSAPGPYAIPADRRIDDDK